MATISGKWNLSTILIEPKFTGADFEEDVNFTADGIQYIRFLFEWSESYWDWNKLEFVKSDLTSVTYIDWNDFEYAENEAIIDFGSTPQNVSNDFYEWFINNALPYGEPKPSLTGKWKFKEILERTGWANTFGFISENINFTANETSFDSIISRTNSSHTALCYNGTDVYVFSYPSYPSANNTWNYAAYRDIDFGSTPQTVNVGFYNWFIANADPEPDSKPVYKKTMNDGWVKQTAYERVEEGWIQISTSE